MVETIAARGALHVSTRRAISVLTPDIEANEAIFRRLLEHLDNAYDRFLWPTLSASDSPVKLAGALATGLEGGSQPAAVILSVADDFGVPAEIADLWPKLAEVLGDGVVR